MPNENESNLSVARLPPAGSALDELERRYEKALRMESAGPAVAMVLERIAHDALATARRLEADAGRYRWLRDKGLTDTETGVNCVNLPMFPDLPWPACLDAAIDAAMRPATETEKQDD